VATACLAVRFSPGDFSRGRRMWARDCGPLLHQELFFLYYVPSYLSQINSSPLHFISHSYGDDFYLEIPGPLAPRKTGSSTARSRCASLPSWASS